MSNPEPTTDAKPPAREDAPPKRSAAAPPKRPPLTFRSRVKRSLQYALVLFVILLAVMAIRAGTLSSRQPKVAPLVDAPIDQAKASAHLAGAIKKKTISESQENPAPAAELEGLRAYLAESFPKTHQKLTREIVNEHALLYTWKAEIGAEAPIILCAHQDVVPVEPGTETKWQKPAFDGVVDDQFIWGRGTLDDKGSLVAILEAIESLVDEGFVPKRTIYLAFGHDEEISGKNGARKIVDVLASRNVKAEMVLDEGNPVVEGIVPSIDGPVAPLGIAEKGYLTVTLSVDLPGGHSSTPARESALGVLTQAIERLRKSPMPARLDGATAEFFAWAAPEMSFGQRMVLGNTWLTWPLVSRVFAKSAALDASIRTTTAVTVFRSGVKDNVVPRTAEAQVNFRVLPGDTTDGVLAHVRSAIDDARVRIEPNNDSRAEPSRVSKTEGRAFDALASTIREVFPGTVVAPALVVGATDGRLYDRVANDVYRFLPVRANASDITRVHGTDERISAKSFADAIRFYRRLLRTLTGS